MIFKKFVLSRDNGKNEVFLSMNELNKFSLISMFKLMNTYITL